MTEQIKYVDKEGLKHAIDKMKEHITNNYVSKSELENINAVLDNINGEVV